MEALKSQYLSVKESLIPHENKIYSENELCQILEQNIEKQFLQGSAEEIIQALRNMNSEESLVLCNGKNEVRFKILKKHENYIFTAIFGVTPYNQRCICSDAIGTAFAGTAFMGLGGNSMVEALRETTSSVAHFAQYIF